MVFFRVKKKGDVGCDRKSVAVAATPLILKHLRSLRST